MQKHLDFEIFKINLYFAKILIKLFDFRKLDQKVPFRVACVKPTWNYIVYIDFYTWKLCISTWKTWNFVLKCPGYSDFWMESTIRMNDHMVFDWLNVHLATWISLLIYLCLSCQFSGPHIWKISFKYSVLVRFCSHILGTLNFSCICVSQWSKSCNLLLTISLFCLKFDKIRNFYIMQNLAGRGYKIFSQYFHGVPKFFGI